MCSYSTDLNMPRHTSIYSALLMSAWRVTAETSLASAYSRFCDSPNARVVFHNSVLQWPKVKLQKLQTSTTQGDAHERVYRPLDKPKEIRLIRVLSAGHSNSEAIWYTLETHSCPCERLYAAPFVRLG